MSDEIKKFTKQQIEDKFHKLSLGYIIFVCDLDGDWIKYDEPYGGYGGYTFSRVRWLFEFSELEEFKKKALDIFRRQASSIAVKFVSIHPKEKNVTFYRECPFDE